MEKIIYEGNLFTIEWFIDDNNKSPVFEFFEKTDLKIKRKFLILIKRMGDFGKIYDITKFRNEGDGLYAFKPKPDRYLCFFVEGKRLIVCHGFTKKSMKLPKKEKEIALKNKYQYERKKQ